MELYPEKYEQLNLTSNEKSFIHTIKKVLYDAEVAYYVLHINPRKKGLDNGAPELFNLLIFDEGLVLFRFVDTSDVNLARLTIKSLFATYSFETIYNDIYEKLKESRYLTDEADELLFGLNICYVFPNIESSQIYEKDNDFINKCRRFICFKDTISNIKKEGKQSLIKMIAKRNYIKEEIVNNIFQRLCPEITIPRKYILDNNEKVNSTDGNLKDIDRAVLSYRLDKGQINIVNKIKKGDQLILACAGSGKSVLLISKCFKLASLNPKENFLITCYNRNLHEYYKWAIGQAGFTDRNVMCKTFFGLLTYLLTVNNIALPNTTNPNKYYDELFMFANIAMNRGRIKNRFTGIFIDEIQIFKPEWYRFCFNLLKNKNPDEHFFVIAGDKSQDIKNNIKSGKAPWQGGGIGYPEYRGKTLPIEINYRNSIQINHAVDSFVEKAKKLGAANGIDLTTDPELFLRGKAYREGSKPKIIELKEYSNNAEAKAICDIVKYYIYKGISEVDIAIILYNRSYNNIGGNWKEYKYDLLKPIKEIFSQEGWEEPAILISDENQGVTIGSREGAVISTIEGALGLDFKAVIVAGLRPLGLYDKMQTTDNLRYMTIEKKEAFMKCINYIYTSCTRAKDELAVVLSAPKGENIYMDLIRDSMGE